MKSKFLAKFIFLFILVFTNCVKDKVRYYELTEAEKQLIPYKLGQVVSFSNSEGEIFDAVVKKDSTYWWVDVYTGFTDLYIHDNLRIVNLQSDSVFFNMNLCISSYGKSINIEISDFNLWFFLHFNINGKFYDDCNDYFNQYIYDNLEIKTKIYYDVVEYILLYANFYDIKVRERLPIRLLYNKTEGILQLEDKDKVLFTITNNR